MLHHIRYLAVEKSLQDRVREYYQYFFDVRGHIDEDTADWIGELPEVMRQNLMISKYKDVILSVDLFEGW